MLKVADCVKDCPRISEIAESASELSCVGEEISTSRAELLMLETGVLAKSSEKSRFGLGLWRCSVVEGGRFILRCRLLSALSHPRRSPFYCSQWSVSLTLREELRIIVRTIGEYRLLNCYRYQCVGLGPPTPSAPIAAPCPVQEV